MERTCTYEQFIVIFLVLSNLAVTETKEFYCTRANNWREAMSTCLHLGGKPMSYRDIADTPDVKLKRGTSVWTADYGFWEIVESVPQLTKDYECGYMRFKQESAGGLNYWYSSSTGVEYDDCSNKRLYFCENEQSVHDDKDTWFQAYQACKSPNKLWSGHGFSSVNIFENPQFWVRSARKFIRDTLKDTIPTKEQLVQCGTSEASVNREQRKNCQQRFQAVCIIETRTDDTKLSHSCLQDTPTTAPATTVSTRKTTLKQTRPTTQLTTTTKPSQLSTETINSTSSLSTHDTPTKVPTTTVSTRKTTLKPTTPTTQLITTTKPSQQSTSTIYSTNSLSTPETPTPTPATTASTGKTTLEATKPTTQLTTTMEPTRQSTEIFNGTTVKSTPGGLPKTKIIIIATGTTAVIICCIVIVIVSSCFGRKRRKSNRKHPRRVKFQTHNPSTKSVVLHSNNDPDDKEGAYDEAHTVYYEVHLDFKDDNNTKEEHGNEKHIYDYGYACNVSEDPKPSYNATKRLSMSESEYDTTNNFKVLNESSNIYNRLGCENLEGFYDSTISKPNRKLVFETNIYSKISRRENLHDTASNVGVDTARLNGAYVSPDDN